MSRCPRCGAVLIAGWCAVHGEPAPEIPADVLAELVAEREPRAAHVPWTDEEIAYALEARGSMNSREIAQALGRTRRGVKNWFGRARVSLPPVSGRPRCPRKTGIASKGQWFWSRAEIEALEDGETKLLLSGRTWRAIKRKAWHIGQPLRSGDGAMSMNQVARRWAQQDRTVLNWIRRGLLPARRSGDVWRIDPDVAERLVPELIKRSRAANGQRGWWQAAEFRAWLESELEEINARERFIDGLVRS